MKIRRGHFILAAIIFLGIFLRAILFMQVSYSGIDGASMMRLGMNLVASGRYSFGENYNWGIFFPPAYPLFVGLTNLITGDILFSGKIVSLLSSTLVIFFFYLIGREICDEEAGLFAAFAFSIHPFILETSVKVETESFFLFTLAVSVYLFMLTFKRRDFILYVLLGLFAGLSYLTRPEGVILALLPAVSSFSFDLKKSRQNFSRAAASLAVFIIVASPYILFLKKETGKYLLSGKGSYLTALLEAGPGIAEDDLRYDRAVYSIADDGMSLTAINRKKSAAVWGFIVNNPSEFFKSYLTNIRNAAVIVAKLIFPAALPLFFTFFIKGSFREIKKLSILFIALFLFTVYPAFFILIRHFFPTVILLILFASPGFSGSQAAASAILDKFGLRLGFLVKHIKPLIVILCLLGSAFISTRTNIFDEKIIPVEHIKAAEFLREKYSPTYEEINVMHRVPWVSFYSGAKFTMLPYAGYADMIEYAKRYHADFIVIDGRTTVRLWENFDELLNLEKKSADVELVYEDHSGEIIKVFKVRY
ncbi:MAG: glycosyltransferase family 39 protein [Nitrospirae bacterium]|nr:glycosyltransferase family 39 protein [Nitrospirota bacterium]